MLPEIDSFQKWLRRKYPHTSTAIHYISDLRLFFAWIKKRPGEITLHEVDAFIEYCQHEGHASATINRRLASLHSFYHFLRIESDEAPPNPVIPRHHFIRQWQPLPRDAHDADVEKLFCVITSLRDRAMFLLMLRCGLRVGEIRHLSLNDLHLQPPLHNLPRLKLHGKGDKQRVVYLSAQPLGALKAWLKVRPKVEEQAVFINRFGHRLTVTGIQDRLAQYCGVAQVWITCHQFRHTLGRHLAEARMPVTSIQRLFGHARLKTTERYISISDGQTQADYDAAMKIVAKRLSLKEGER